MTLFATYPPTAAASARTRPVALSSDGTRIATVPVRSIIALTLPPRDSSAGTSVDAPPARAATSSANAPVIAEVTAALA